MDHSGSYFFLAERPQRPMNEIGSILVRTLNREVAFKTMKREASKRGGHGVIDIRFTPAGISGTVIRFGSTNETIVQGN